MWGLFRKLRIELPHNPAIPLQGINLEKIKTPIRKDSMHPSVHSGTVYNSQDKEATYTSINRWLDKQNVAHIYVQWSITQPEKEQNVICSNTDGYRDYHTKSSKSEGERQIPWYHLYVESKKEWCKLISWQDRKDPQTQTDQRGREGEGKLGMWAWQIHTTTY